MKPITYKPGMPVFARFGEWPSRSRNHSTGQLEAGVSVLQVSLAGNVVTLADEDIAYYGRHCLIVEGRLLHLVTGRVVGIGSDHEPVIVGVRPVLGLAIERIDLDWLDQTGKRTD